MSTVRSQSVPVAPPNDTVLAIGLCLLVTAALCSTCAECWHWFVFPVLLCGFLVTGDAIGWLRGRLDLMDPVGIIGIIGFHFFFLAPLLHVYWDFWNNESAPPTDWRLWLGLMATFNAAGLAVYKAYLAHRERAESRRVPNPERTVWQLQGKRAWIVLAGATAIAVALQAYTYARSGGLYGYVMDFTLKNDVFAGTGWMAMISEAAPILLLMAFATEAGRRRNWRSWPVLIAVIVGFLVLRLLFGGLKGNRSHTIYGMIWALGIIHMCVRPVPRKLILVGALLGMIFMYLYGFYKVLGAGVFALPQGTTLEDLQQEVPTRDVHGLLLGDLGHASVQAYLLYKLWAVGDYQPAYGLTYWGAICQIVPRGLWPDRPPTEEAWTTQLERGRGMYSPMEVAGPGRYNWVTSHVLGIGGETILNFGPGPIPLAFLLWAIVVGAVRGMPKVWGRTDARMLVVPLLMTVCIKLMVADTGNVVWYIFKEGLMPGLVLLAGAQRLRCGAPAQPQVKSAQAPATL